MEGHSVYHAGSLLNCRAKSFVRVICVPNALDPEAKYAWFLYFAYAMVAYFKVEGVFISVTPPVYPNEFRLFRRSSP